MVQLLHRPHLRGQHRENTQPDTLSARIDARYSTEAALDEWSHYRWFPEERYLVSKYYTAGQTVLDHACGAGRTTLLLHERSMRVTGVDISPVAIQYARRRFPYLRFEQGNFTDIAATDEAFDHVLVSHNSLDHAYPESERVHALRELARVLKPGGTLLISSHNIKSLHFSPLYAYYFPGDQWRLPWMLRNALAAFRDHAYVMDNGLPEYYASSDYVIRQVVAQGFHLLESVGLRASHNRWFNTFCSPYLHYIFRKGRAGEGAREEPAPAQGAP